MPFTYEQIERLLTPVRGDRVEQKQGMSYVPTHEVKAELTRTFGPGGWDHTIHDVRLLWESETPPAKEGGKTMYRACYMVACTLRVRDFDGNPMFEATEYHAEANSNLPDRGEAHAMALTSAESYALRRAALGLGDSTGLHLYNRGSLAPLVKGSLIIEARYSEEATAARESREAAMKAAREQAQAAMNGHGSQALPTGSAE